MGVGVLYVGTEVTNQNDPCVLPLSDSAVEGRRWIYPSGGGEWSGPWHELRGFLLKDWSASSGGIAEEGDRASSFHPSVGSESIDSLKLGSTDRLTSYSSYFEELSTESESGGIFELETISSEDDCVFVS